MISRDTFDAHLKGALDAAGCAQPLKEMWAKYQIAKSKLPTEVLTWIAKSESQLTDHGIPHIENVIENAARLLGLDASYSHESGSGRKSFEELHVHPVEAYLLGMALMFHDTGNILSRKGHADSARSVVADLMKGILRPDEIRVISSVMAAHTGVSQKGCFDKISDLPEPPEYLNKEPVRLRPLAAIVRFADELAEGAQRTSNFLRDRGDFTLKDENGNARNPFHDYASITQVNIDRGNGRIAVTYGIELDDKMFSQDGKERLGLLLAMVCHRIHKIDDERRYARFYGGTWLQAFQTTEVAIHFYRRNLEVPPQLPLLILNDLVVPGSRDSVESDKKWVKKHNQAYDMEEIIKQVWP